jgi:hypothetical protein
MRGASRDGLPADPAARDLAYEWIESYLYDHRPAAEDAVAAAVPSERLRAGPLLWDAGLALFRHDPFAGAASYWGRGNGWAAWGLARSARHLDAPYAGGRYEDVVDRAGIREVLSRLASALAARRGDDGGWPSDLSHPEACPAGETSATGLITYMLAAGVREGWLDRAAYTPVVLKAFALLLRRLDAVGDLAGIQPPGTGPDCAVTASNDPAVDVSYGVGAFLLAASEVSKLPDADLAALEAAAALPVDRSPVGRTWVVALPGGCDRREVLLTNAGAGVVHARLELGTGAPSGSGSVDVAPGSTARIGIVRAADDGSPVVRTLRADGDLLVEPRAVCGDFAGADGAEEPFLRPRSRRAGTAVPLWNALAGSESASLVELRDGVAALGGKNTSPRDASMVVEIHAPDESLLERFALELPAGGAAFETRFVAAGSRVILSNTTEGAAVVPLRFPESLSGNPPPGFTPFRRISSASRAPRPTFGRRDRDSGALRGSGGARAPKDSRARRASRGQGRIRRGRAGASSRPAG